MTLNETLDIFGWKESDERYCLYAPLEHAAAVVNAAAMAAVNRFLHEGESCLTDGELAVIRKLQEGGVLSCQPAAKPVAPRDYLFRPCEVTLFPTTRCNLRCIYCYADAGYRVSELSWEASKAAIDFVSENALVTGCDHFVLGFHGGGEPTLNWPLVLRCVEYAHEIAERQRLNVNIHAASNGVLNLNQREFIARYFNGINLSIDGPQSIHDRQRPRDDGRGSFECVMETVQYFESVRFPYGVRTTITENSVLQLREIVHFFRGACPSLNQLHVEPVWWCGRCKTSGEKTPDGGSFSAHFLSAWEEGHRLNLSLFYSGARLDAITNKFCAAPGDGFSVTPEGMVTSCFEVTEAHDPRAALFHYGQYDSGAGKFVFDDCKIATLRQLTVDHISHCADCFCKWHCGGDCLAKVLAGADLRSHHGSPRCDVNRAITSGEIRRILERAGKSRTSP